MDIKRGNIHYIEIPNAIGHEMMKDRPGVIISCDPMNYTSPVVSVVFLTGSRPADVPYHVKVSAAASVRHGTSTALCEHIYTVDKSRVGKCMGRCSEEEMAAIDDGILMSLALGDGKYKGPQSQKVYEKDACVNITKKVPEIPAVEPIALAVVERERDIYKGLYEKLLDSMTMERRIGA